jgi:hypothetical protein
MKSFKVWDIQVLNGGLVHNHKYYVSTKEAADEWMKNNTYDCVREMEFIVFDSYNELMLHKSGEARKRALSKLTMEDKIALGIADYGTVPVKKKVCSNKINGVCTRHNLQCSYPDCEK